MYFEFQFEIKTVVSDRVFDLMNKLTPHIYLLWLSCILLNI